MAVTVVFAIVGSILKQSTAKVGAPFPASSGMSGPQGASFGKTTSPFIILLGGAVGTGLLVGIAEFGEAGERIGLGLAVIAMLSSTLVNGGPVWDWLGQKFGSKPTVPLSPTLATGVSQTTGLTAPTVATVATTSALA